MNKSRFFGRGWLTPFSIVFMIFLASCSADNTDSVASAQNAVMMDLYASPTCGCCSIWQEHAQERGFAFNFLHRDNDELTLEKLRLGINLRYHSCHTAVSADGSVFEGHVPAYLIHQYLAAKPADSIGLAVPGMPLGSPGMEAGDRLNPYDVLLLKTDGSTEVYGSITNLQMQYQ